MYKCCRFAILTLLTLAASVAALRAQQRVFARVQPNAGIDLPTAETYDSGGGTVTPASGNMFEGRDRHTATLLSDGRVLLAGGHNGQVVLSTAEVFDPSTRTFAQTPGNMYSLRYRHTATLLSNGKVLIAGGSNGGFALNTAELFDPSSGTFSEVANTMVASRQGHTATLLSDGKVLITGGFDGTSVLNSAELYDPDAGTFTLVANLMTAARDSHTATLLAGGKVLLAGGRGATDFLASAEVYDPSGGSFTATSGSMPDTREGHTATRLSDDKVLIVGGYNGNYLTTAVVYDPGPGTFSATAKPLGTPRRGHGATLLGGGLVLIAGGTDGKSALNTAEIYTPSSGSFAPAPTLSSGRNGCSATTLPGDAVLVAGGQSRMPLVFDVNLDRTDNVSPNIVFSSDSTRGLVPYTGSGVVVLFNPANGEIVQRIATGGKPALAARMADGHTVGVVSALDNRIFVIDMAASTLVRTLTFAGSQFGFGSTLSISPDGRYGYVSSTGTGDVLKFNMSDGSEAGRLRGVVAPTSTTLTADGATLLVVDTANEELLFVDTAGMTKKYTMKAKETQPAADFTIFNRPVLAKDGLTGVIASQDVNGFLGSDTAFVFQVSTGKVLAAPKIGSQPGFTGLTPDGKYWVILCEFSLTLLHTTDPGTPSDLQTVQGESIGSASIAFSPDSTYAYYASSPNDLVFQHNILTGAVVSKVTTGDVPNTQEDQPAGVAITADGSVVAALNFMANNVELLAREYVLSAPKFLTSPEQVSGVTLVNPTSKPANLSIYALNNYGELLTGPDVVNPVEFTLHPNRQISETVQQLFGFHPSGELAGWISVHSDQPGIVGYATIGRYQISWFDFYYSELDGYPLLEQPVHEWILPEIPTAGLGSAEFNLVNPNFNQATYDSARVSSLGLVIDSTTGNIAYPTNRQLTSDSIVVDRPQAGFVLITGGRNPDSVLNTAETYDPGGGSFGVTAGGMAGTRVSHTATSLKDGGVLIVGGQNSGGALSTAETYDPATGVFSATAGAMTVARHSHTATLLADGRVLLAGGNNLSGADNTAETYDPLLKTFSKTSGTLTSARTRHRATLLLTGKVLITGGSDGSAGLSSAELFDPSTGSFAATGSMSVKRDYHTATRLPSGKVLVVGGHDGTDYLASAEIYDPTTATFSATAGSLAAARREHTATLLSNGKVLIAGGVNSSGTLNSLELFDPATGTFSSAGTMATPRQNHIAIRLLNDKVLIAGGAATSNPLNTADLYDPAAGSVSATGVMTALRSGLAAAVLQSESSGDGYYRMRSGEGLFDTTLASSRASFVALNAIDLSRYAGVYRVYAPHFATTGQYRTVLNIINANKDDAEVTITLRKPNGDPIGLPRTFVLGTGAQLRRDLELIFPDEVHSGDLTGWIQVESTQDFVVGTVTLTDSDENFRTTLELSGSPLTDFAFPIAAEDRSFQTGVALLNTSEATARVTIELWGPGATLDRTTTVDVAPWNRMALYLSNIFPNLQQRQLGNIRVHSDVPLHSYSIVNDRNLNFMAALPPVPLVVGGN